MAPFESLGSFLVAFHSKYGFVLYHFETKRDIGRKSRFFIHPLHSTSPLGGPSRNIVILYW